MTASIAQLAGELHVEQVRRGVERPSWDLIVAAHAIHHGVPLATADRGFEKIDGLSIVRIASR